MTTTGTAQPGAATGPTRALMAEINAAFNSRDVDRIMTFFAEDCTFLMARGPERWDVGSRAGRPCAACSPIGSR
jgi:hypothetical protein